MSNDKIMSILEKFNDKMYTGNIYKEFDKTLKKLIANGMDAGDAEAILNEMIDEMYVS